MIFISKIKLLRYKALKLQTFNLGNFTQALDINMGVAKKDLGFFGCY